jgi:plasmid stabilization system protein ParE
MRVVWTKAATRGVWRAYEYLYELNPRAAEHLAASLFATADGLVNFPHLGRLVPKTEMREIVSVYPYIIRYRIDGDTVVILRVRHSARRPTSP